MAHQSYIPDDWLDEVLADVPVPAGMLARLDAISQLCQLPDDELDAWLQDVPAPAGLVARLQEQATLADADLDDWLQQVPSPAGLAARLERVPQQSSRRTPSTRWSVAAALLLAAGVTYFASVYVNSTDQANVAKTRPPRDAGRDRRPGDVPAWTIDPETLALAATKSDDHEPTTPEVELAEIDLLTPAPSPPGPLEGLAGSGRPAKPAALDARHAGVFGSGQIEDDLPELHRLDGLFPRGMEPPRVPGYDLVFQELSGFHPFVSPGAHADLARSAIPLGIVPTSYDLTRRCLLDNELPPREAVRTEEFLAAMNYGYKTPAKGQLALLAAGGPSPLGSANQRLLQVSVQAGQLDSHKRKPVALTIAVDASRSMQWGERLSMVRQSVLQIAARMQADDRLSLIVLGDGAQVFINDAGVKDREAIELAAAAIVVQSGANPEAGLPAAVQLAESFGAQGAERKLVLVSDGGAQLDAGDVERALGALKNAAGRGLRLTVLDLGRDQQPSAQWVELASAAGGESLRAASTDEARWALLKTLTGRAQVVAQDAQLSVTFNPQVVASYRLFGHESTLLPAATSAALHAGETASGLYELQLKPGGTLVATIQLKWKDPVTGQPRAAAKHVLRTEFATKATSSVESLQLATLAAETAEWLRRSPYRDASSPLPLRELAIQTAERLPENASCQELAQLVQRAERARPARPMTRRSSAKSGK